MRRIIPSGLFLAMLAAAGSPGRADDAWSKELVKRGIDPALVENPIAITQEIRSAADAMSGRIQSALFDASRFTFDYAAAARLASARGRLGEARRAAHRAIKLDPGNVEAATILDALGVGNSSLGARRP